MPLEGVKCPFVFEGTLDKILFSDYLRNQLLPTLSPDDIILLDNSSVHKSQLVIDTMEECGIKYLFLPPYSPDLNPIELLWAYVKSVLRKLKARTQDRLDEAIKTALDNLTPEVIANWFKHCGYSTDIC